MKHQTLLALILGLATAAPLNAKWQRIPIAEDKPLPIGARGMLSEGSLASSSGLGKAESLLSPDPTDPVSVATGNSSAVIGLAKPTLFNRSSFTNDGIEGRATLSGSADNKGWAVLDEKVFSASDRSVTFSFAGMQVKFIKLEFAVSKGGTIRNFQMFGGERDKDYTVRQAAGDPSKGYPVNFAGVGGSRIIYASPKPDNNLDEVSSYNKFEFPESDERYRTLVYDLGQLRLLNKFSSVHSPRPVRLEVFAFDKLPEKEDWRGRLAFNPADFNAREPVAAAEDTRGLGFLKASPSKPVGARYVAMRWEPEFNPPGFGVDGTNVGGSTVDSGSNFSAAGVPPAGGSGGTDSTPGGGGPGAGSPPGGSGTPPPGGSGTPPPGGNPPSGGPGGGGGVINGSVTGGINSGAANNGNNNANNGSGPGVP